MAAVVPAAETIYGLKPCPIQSQLKNGSLPSIPTGMGRPEKHVVRRKNQSGPGSVPRGIRKINEVREPGPIGVHFEDRPAAKSSSGFGGAVKPSIYHRESRA